jgi:hypothetical protein
MKKITLFFWVIAFVPVATNAQIAADTLAINSLSLGITNVGAFIPMQHRASQKSLLFSGGLWLSAKDSSQTLCGSFQDYLGAAIHFSPGPISSNPLAQTLYNRVWKVNKAMVDSFVNGFYGTNIPAQIANWPAHGNTSFGESFYLAPFVDVNADGYYSPSLGDYPCIQGNQAVFFMMNDETTNGLRTAPPLGVEFLGMAYAYSSNTFIDSAIFVSYTVRFKRKNLQDIRISMFADFDIGNSIDDIVGTFVDQNTIVAYNADADDQGPLGFGQHPPAAGLTILNGLKVDYYDGLDNDKDGCVDGVRDTNGLCQPIVPGGSPFEYDKLLNAMAFTNNPTTPMGNPQTAMEYSRYMRSIWRDGVPLRYENPSGFLNPMNGDGYSLDTLLPAVGFIFPGNSYDTSGAFEPSAPTNWFASPTLLGDYRLLATVGSLDTILMNDELHIKTAFFMARDTNSLNSYNAAHAMAVKINNHVETIPNCSGSRLVGMAESALPTFTMYPNPAQNWLTVAALQAPNATGKIVGLDGRVLVTFTTDESGHAAVAVSSLPNGVYVIRIGEKTERLLIQK